MRAALFLSSSNPIGTGKGEEKMKRLTAFLTIAMSLLLFGTIVPGRSKDLELGKRHVKSVEMRNVSPRNGRNVALDINVKAPVGASLPKGITALLNDRQVHFYDDGRWPDERAGDGVYSVAGATKSGEPLDERTTLRVQSTELFEHHAALPKISCTLKVVECPSDCKSVLFHSKCVICLKLESCEIGLE